MKIYELLWFGSGLLFQIHRGVYFPKSYMNGIKRGEMNPLAMLTFEAVRCHAAKRSLSKLNPPVQNTKFPHE